jgi:serine/threonine protein kinase
LQELHDRSIIHHDLKPDNILYDPINSSIKISDFSSSFQIDEFMKLGEEHKNLIANNTSPYHKAPFKLTERSSLIGSDKYACAVTILQLYGFSLIDIKSDIKKVVCKLLIKNRSIYYICYSLIRSFDHSNPAVRSFDHSIIQIPRSDLLTIQIPRSDLLTIQI